MNSMELEMFEVETFQRRMNLFKKLWQVWRSPSSTFFLKFQVKGIKAPSSLGLTRTRRDYSKDSELRS
jgi:hypothetical protein